MSSLRRSRWDRDDQSWRTQPAPGVGVCVAGGDEGKANIGMTYRALAMQADNACCFAAVVCPTLFIDRFEFQAIRGGKLSREERND